MRDRTRSRNGNPVAAGNRDQPTDGGLVTWCQWPTWSQKFPRILEPERLSRAKPGEGTVTDGRRTSEPPLATTTVRLLEEPLPSPGSGSSLSGALGGIGRHEVRPPVRGFPRGPRSRR